MNEANEHPMCPRCGSPVPAEAPGGQCPRCLLGAVAAPLETTEPAANPGDWPALEEVRAAFPELLVEGEIGRGGMAVVFKARQTHLDRAVALKVLAPWLAAQAGFADRFTREAKVLAKLSHPNIVTIHDFGQSAGFFFLLMEYMDGVNLRQAMRAGRFTPEQALGLVPKICDALQYAHGEGVLHRDIKPDNILLDSRGRVKIADFGIAKLVGESDPAFTLTRSGMHLGTPAYMAPEQLEKPGEVDHRADIYSLGVVFYEMLTGELPLGRFAAPSAMARVDSRIDEIVFRTLEKERERRYQSAEEVKTKVEGLAGAPAAMPGPTALAAAGHVADEAPLAGKSVWGAVATALSLCGAAFLMVTWTMPMVQVSHGPSDPPSPSGLALGMMLLATLVAVAVLAAGLAGALLGASALSDIRRSGGRKRGAGLAAFALLTWPLLIGTGAGIGLTFALGEAAFGPGFGPAPGGWLHAATVTAGVGAVIWLDFSLVRGVLRWAHGGRAAASPPVRVATAPPVPPTPPAGAEATPNSGLALAGGILTGLSLLSVVLPTGFMLWLLGTADGGRGSVGALGAMERIVILALGSLPGLAGMVLGVVAMHRIRNSRGQIGGAAWAVFAAMAWPVLLLVLLGLAGGLLVGRAAPGGWAPPFAILAGIAAAVYGSRRILCAATAWTRGSQAAW